MVDNAPTSSATADLFVQHHWGDDRFDYILEQMPGVSRAKNLGASRARFDLLAFTDDDALPDPGWLSALTRTFASPQVSCVTGLTLPSNLAGPFAVRTPRGPPSSTRRRSVVLSVDFPGPVNRKFSS